MARKKPSAGIGTNPVPFGMSNKQMKRKKPINLDYIKRLNLLLIISKYSLTLTKRIRT